MNFNTPIVELKLDSQTGASKLESTPVTTSHKGVELSVSADIVSNKDWNWAIGVNLTTANSKLDVDNPTKELDIIFAPEKVKFLPQNGKSPNSMFGYEFAGIDPESGFQMWYMGKGDAANAAYRQHYEKLLHGCKITDILDCSFGTGNLTFELCELGYKVWGSDLSEAMLSQAEKKAEEKGVEIVRVLLHVGLGTFRPVKEDDLTNHVMHSEFIKVTPEAAERINAVKQRGGRVIAVGTTSVRTLESATDESGIVHPFEGETSIFIYPGVKFKCVDAVITNFHLPESTLIMLVCAFAGYDNTMNAYKEAVKEKYHFFSFGDAMFIS